MNPRTPGLPLAKAISGFLLYKTAEVLSPNTLRSYQDHLTLWLKYTGEVTVERITPPDLCAFLAWLRSDYTPRRFDGSRLSLSAKTLRNYWVTLSAFFRWASIEFSLTNPMRSVPAPHFEEAPVEPFTQPEVEALLRACEFCQDARPIYRQRFTMRRRTAHRDRAIILMLLDTRLRASKLCALTIGDVDQKTGKVQVKHGQHGGAKGGRAAWCFSAKRRGGRCGAAARGHA